MRPKRFGAARLAALLLCLNAPGDAAAQDVTLTSRDGSFALEGILLGFDGEFYRIDTIYGGLTVDGLGVTCAGPGCPNLEAYVAEVSLAGAETMGAVLMPALLEAFAAARGLNAGREDLGPRRFRYSIADRSGRTLARFSFQLTTTDAGLAALIAGETDLAMAAREVRADELVLAREAGIGMLSAPNQGRIVALDAVVAAVAPENPLTSVRPEALARVLAGEIIEWGALGGPEGEPLRLHALESGLGAQQAIENTILAPAALAMSENARRHGDPARLARALSGDPYAIGITLQSALGPARALGLSGGCGFALLPQDAAVRSEDYPYIAPLFLYMPNRRLPAISRDFLSFLSSPVAGRVIRRAGFTDLGTRRVPLAEQGERLAKAILAAGDETTLAALQRMVTTLAGADRLSPTFRFRTGAAGLDAPSRGNALLLAEAIEAGAYDGHEMLFVGFSDGEGSAEVNLRIAKARAETVLSAVRALAETADLTRLRLRAEAFGEALPMACDDSDWGRRINRRVEVWLR